MARDTNLLKETRDALSSAEKTESDVRWVGSSDGAFAMSWKEFELLAQGINYDCGYGGNEIAGSLVVVGKDWWLERGEYDGSEWWQFKSKPVRQKKAKRFSNVLNVKYEDAIR